MEYEFTLKFALPANQGPTDELVERLGEAGCDDALVGIGHAGRVALEFTRAADSAKQAIFSALTAVKTAIPDAMLLEVTPDFVGLTDIADYVGVTRQNMRKLMLTQRSFSDSSTRGQYVPVASFTGPCLATRTRKLHDPGNAHRGCAHGHADQSRERGAHARAQRAEGNRRARRIVH